jgi:hypothetical protein
VSGGVRARGAAVQVMMALAMGWSRAAAAVDGVMMGASLHAGEAGPQRQLVRWRGRGRGRRGAGIVVGRLGGARGVGGACGLSEEGDWAPRICSWEESFARLRVGRGAGQRSRPAHRWQALTAAWRGRSCGRDSGQARVEHRVRLLATGLLLAAAALLLAACCWMLGCCCRSAATAAAAKSSTLHTSRTLLGGGPVAQCTSRQLGLLGARLAGQGSPAAWRVRAAGRNREPSGRERERGRREERNYRFAPRFDLAFAPNFQWKLENF